MLDYSEGVSVYLLKKRQVARRSNLFYVIFMWKGSVGKIGGKPC